MRPEPRPRINSRAQAARRRTLLRVSMDIHELCHQLGKSAWIGKHEWRAALAPGAAPKSAERSWNRWLIALCELGVPHERRLACSDMVMVATYTRIRLGLAGAEWADRIYARHERPAPKAKTEPDYAQADHEPDWTDAELADYFAQAFA